MGPENPQFQIASKEEMAAQLKQESADYAAAQKPERNEGYMASGVNQFVRGSQNINPEPVTEGTGFTFTGTKDPFKA